MKIKFLLISIMVFAVNFLKAQIPNTLTINDKIYGLSKFWSEANYNFVYMYKVDQTKWNDAYINAINKIQTTKNDYEYFRELQKLCAVLKDGHTQVYMPENIQNQILITNFGEYRLFLTSVEDKIYVYNVNKSKEKDIPIGSEITRVNGLSTKEYQMKYVDPYISTSTQNNLKHKAAYRLLEGLEGEQYSIEIKTPKGKTKKIYLTHSKTEEQELSSKPLPQRDVFEFKWLKDNIAYIAIRTFDNVKIVKDFEAKLPELQKAKKIIIDVRDNGGGSSRNALNIAKYFTKSDTIYGAKNYSREIIPTERALGSFLTVNDTIKGKSEWGLSKQETTDLYKAYLGAKFHNYEYKPTVIHSDIKLTVPTTILTNTNTASASEDFLIYLYNEKNIARIGDYTNGSTGQPLQIGLPGNTTAWICTKKVTLPSGDEFVGYGIKPTILAIQNLNDVLYPNKYDSQLEKAIEYLKKQ